MTTVNNNIRFTAYDQLVLMRQVGERYETDNERDEPEDYEIFDTEDEAAKWIDARVAQLTEDGELYHITKTRRGLDSIEYHNLAIDREVYDAEWDEWNIDDDFESTHSTDTLPDEVRDAAFASERSYHKFLDYEADTYHGINA